MDYRRYANVETNLFPQMRDTFHQTGTIDPYDLWAVLAWKANRKKERHLERFNADGLTFAQATDRMADGIRGRTDPEERLRFMLQEMGFRLPTATAILSVLFPEEYPIYDRRVCSVLAKRFSGIGHLKPDHPDLWTQYCAYKQAIIDRVPDAQSLREADHVLWGMSWYAQARDVFENRGAVSRAPG